MVDTIDAGIENSQGNPDEMEPLIIIFGRAGMARVHCF
jgi:hypothetical protein